MNGGLIQITLQGQGNISGENRVDFRIRKSDTVYIEKYV